MGLKVRGSPNWETMSAPPYLPGSGVSWATCGRGIAERAAASATTLSRIVRGTAPMSGMLQRCVPKGQPLHALRELHRHDGAHPSPLDSEHAPLPEPALADLVPPGTDRHVA